MYKLFTVCTEQVRSPFTEHAASGLYNPTHLEREVRFDQAQDQQVVTTRSPRIVTECYLTCSMLIKMYVDAIYSRFRIGNLNNHGPFLAYITMKQNKHIKTFFVGVPRSFDDNS